MIDIRLLYKRIYNKIYTKKYRRRFAACGTEVYFTPYDSEMTYENMYLGNNVYIGPKADMVATRSKIIIGNHVVFGPHVSIRGGDHRTDIVGKFIDEVGDNMKLPENDADVILEGDNWIGMNVTILKGVTIGRGAIIAAGSVVNKSIPPYSIAGGVPARVLKKRFSEEDIRRHEEILYGTGR